jgi:hypothetical protein
MSFICSCAALIVRYLFGVFESVLKPTQGNVPERLEQRCNLSHTMKLLCFILLGNWKPDNKLFRNRKLQIKQLQKNPQIDLF